MKRSSLIICLISMWWASRVELVFGQSPALSFNHYSTRDGLSSGIVYDIMKDRFGFLWLATEDGLNRFDGTNFKVYRHDPTNLNGLRVNHISCVYEGRDGLIWIGTNGGGVSIYDSHNDSVLNYTEPGIPVAITSIKGDKEGNIWVTGYGNLQIIDPVSKKLITKGKYAEIIREMTGKSTVCTFEDSQRNIWIGTNLGVYRFSAAQKKLQAFRYDAGNPASLVHNRVNQVVEDSHGMIWIATDGGLSRLDPLTGSFKNYGQTSHPALSSNVVLALKADNRNRLWIGTEEGLNVLDIATQQLSVYIPDNRDPRSLSSRSVRAIFADHDGIFWISTFREGLNKYDENFHYFPLKEYNAFDPFGLRSPLVTSFASYGKDVFIGTDGGGLHLYHRNTGLLDPIPLPLLTGNKGHDLSILTLEMSAGKRLWIGTFMNGLYCYSPSSRTHKHYKKGPGASKLNSNDIFCIKEDTHGNTWVGTNGGGINIIRPNNTIAKLVHTPNKMNDDTEPASNFIRVIEEDRAGRMWIGTYGAGISVMNPENGTFSYYTKANSGLPSDYVLAIIEDTKGNIWAGTGGNGLGVLKKGSARFELLSEKDGLANGFVYKIIEDTSGRLWLSTNAGLSSFDVTTGKFKNYDAHQGLQAGAFIHGAGLKMPDGELFFGGQNGFNYFNPLNMKTNKNIPKVVFTGLKIDNQPVTPTANGPITQSILLAEELHLKYNQNFSIDFEALNFTVPEANQYEYQLAGIDKNWITAGRQHSAYYSNLAPGEYLFKVKASNNDGVWNEEGRSIRIVIAPPFWRTPLAYVLYLLLVVGILLYIRHLGIKKLRTRFVLEQERLQARQLVEQERKEADYLHKLDKVKIRFLTNLSHEFRTPISLIMGPVDKLMEQVKEESLSGQLNLIKRNARRLLNLVNQLLDFRKMEEHELKVQLSEGDLVAFTKEVWDTFNDLAKRKHIHFGFETTLSTLTVAFDHDKVERILFNLLSNAFKFTPEKGHIAVELHVQEDIPSADVVHVSFVVKDSGIGIPQEAHERIFESFFQHETNGLVLNQGTGIGLAIAKEFVQLHHGTISVESEQGVGSRFTFDLILQKATSVVTATTHETLLPEAVAASVNKQPGLAMSMQPSILIVEDDDDFRFYIKENLKTQFRIIEASNGKEGWQQTLFHHPDIIVSDVQMPVVNGLEFAQKLKSDKRTLHIPVVLLTATSRPDAMLDGLETGAIDYLVKPFDFAVLQAKIHNILLLHQSFKDTYSKQVTVSLPETQILSAKEEFLQKALNYIYENLDNSQLSVESLSAHLCISRASLYNRVFEYAGMSPVEFIRTVKLEKAKDLLERSDKTVTEIAYETGFTNANYFTKVFKSKYNLTPSEYRAEIKK